MAMEFVKQMIETFADTFLEDFASSSQISMSLLGGLTLTNLKFRADLLNELLSTGDVPCRVSTATIAKLNVSLKWGGGVCISAEGVSATAKPLQFVSSSSPTKPNTTEDNNSNPWDSLVNMLNPIKMASNRRGTLHSVSPLRNPPPAAISAPSLSASFSRYVCYGESISPRSSKKCERSFSTTSARDILSSTSTATTSDLLLDTGDDEISLFPTEVRILEERSLYACVESAMVQERSEKVPCGDKEWKRRVVYGRGGGSATTPILQGHLPDHAEGTSLGVFGKGLDYVVENVERWVNQKLHMA
eukprot:TRINITY_DN178600_c0_g1_i1.p1 TRINITY_DN178600_c0_g1~~TRINITY_DN178600_c0_g1_i1.p1  ORF type:complete len:303 (+),score=22.60 TRINITY_DN178600_c0_g1_i1:34-942(+)